MPACPSMQVTISPALWLAHYSHLYYIPPSPTYSCLVDFAFFFFFFFLKWGFHTHSGNFYNAPPTFVLALYTMSFSIDFMINKNVQKNLQHDNEVTSTNDWKVITHLWGHSYFFWLPSLPGSCPKTGVALETRHDSLCHTIHQE